MAFHGSHSDVGGGYEDGGNRHALHAMIESSKAHGVPIDTRLWSKDQKEFYNKFPNGHHESRWSTTGLADLFIGITIGIYERRVYTGNVE